MFSIPLKIKKELRNEEQERALMEGRE